MPEPAETVPPAPPSELTMLRRQLERERTRRRAAEDIGEQATADLFETVQELRAVQAEILERADRERVVNDLARELRQELDTTRLLQRAARAVGQATRVDRCQVHVVEPVTLSADWVADGCTLPAATPLTWYPVALLELLQAADPHRRSVEICDMSTDPRIDGPGAREVRESLGTQALVASPMWVGTHLVGWLVLQSTEPRVWRERELAISDGLATDLGATLLQVRAYEHQHEAMRRLRELDRARDAFISNVSHELRTPLTSICGYLELLAAGDLGSLDAKVLRAVDVIGRNAERLRHLVEDLLTLSAYDADEVRLHRSTVDVTSLLADCQRALVPLLVRRALDIRIETAADLACIHADRTHVERIVLNLLTNAVKFTPDGGSVTVRAGNTSVGIALTVVDTGIGIPAAEQEQLFSRFFRSSLSTAAEIQGTGLGLALTRTLVEQHGGTIDLESAEGVGTTVTVHLPSGSPASH